MGAGNGNEGSNESDDDLERSEVIGVELVLAALELSMVLACASADTYDSLRHFRLVVVGFVFVLERKCWLVWFLLCLFGLQTRV